MGRMGGRRDGRTGRMADGQNRRQTKKGREGFPSRPSCLSGLSRLERKSKSELADALLRTPEIPRVGGRFQQRRIRRSARQIDTSPEAARVDVVEQIEDLTDGF